ncbi:excreted/secreted protein 23 [Trypanosoma theileri]|uniref:Excreted/secreted protein 23 n=1 Tax=Trypanosoma theileri TaxID=67003 RepID=A0A1X0NYR9_9TRYP|nr:excreted/secreted protein 23 [Trypanosoma theileri]ORC89300.1 excreted/secreted protein 23 [Trypanosoma theileri]
MASGSGILRLTPLRSGPLQYSVCKRFHTFNRSNPSGLRHAASYEGSLQQESGGMTCSTDDFNDQTDPGRRERESMLTLLKEQGERRIARREAFLQWQAGQREKGAAHRLLRQAKTQEKFKRHHYHTQNGRLISVSFTNEDGTSSNSDGNMNFHFVEPRRTECRSTDFLVPSSRRCETSTLNLTLQKR